MCQCCEDHREPAHGKQWLVQHSRVSNQIHTFVGSLISAANLPQGRCRTPLYLTAPLALTPFTGFELLPLLLGLLMPDEEAECILCMWLRLGDLPLLDLWS